VVPVGVEDDGALTEHLFEAVGVELGLLPTGLGIDAGLLGLDFGAKRIGAE
jgi:hypothetical protein